MSNYWHARYLETLSQADGATSERARMAYLDLADHYQAMYRLCRLYPADNDYRAAA
jgi:hypothetical protein